MADYTKKGHKLEFVKERDAMVFSCEGQVVGWDKEKSFMKGTNVLARLQIIAPITKGQMRRVLVAWLGAYDDDELVGQVEGVADGAVGGFPELPPAAAQKA
jgi:hypothetical protein